jgi:hypothetical protein
MRSEHGRRFRDIVEAEFGPVADTVRLRELAGFKYTPRLVAAKI